MSGDILDNGLTTIINNNEQWAKETTAQEILTDTGTTLPAEHANIVVEVDANETKIDSIKVDTGTDLPAQITSDHATTDALIASEHVVTDALITSEHVTTDALISSEHVTTDALVSSEALANRTHVTDQHTITKNAITVAITASEGNIRGADSDTLKTISDQIDALPDDADIATVMAELTKILGLHHFNYYLDNVVVNTVAGVTTETHRVRVYSDKTSVGTGSDVVLTANIEAKYGVDKILQTFKGVDGS